MPRFTSHIAATRAALADAMRALSETERARFAEEAALEFGGTFIPESAPSDRFQQPAQFSLLGCSSEDFSTLAALSMWASAVRRSADAAA